MYNLRRQQRYIICLERGSKFQSNPNNTSKECVYFYFPPSLTHSIPACNCNEAGTTHEICASVTENGVEAGTCICKANVLPSAKCDSCKPEHYGLDASNPLGCTGLYLAVKFDLGVKFDKKLT